MSDYGRFGRFSPRRGGAVSAAGLPAIPLQRETSDLLSRFSTAPSATYKSALNQAIYRWKQAGVWSLFQDFYLFCADTPEDSLRNLVTAARDATISGAPTFTALKGFNGLGASDYVSMPFDTTGLVAFSGCLWAGAFDCSLGAVTLMGQGPNFQGSVVSRTSGSNTGVSFGVAGAVAFQSQSGIVAVAMGAQSVQTIVPSGLLSNGAGSAGFTASPLVANSANQARLMAWGTLPSASGELVRGAVSILHTFLEDVGALP
jgi:hypothetical protein